MRRYHDEPLSISHFKATCLAVLDRVRRTGRPILVTKRGVPIAEIVPAAPAAAGGAWLGALKGTAQVKGDLVAPAAASTDWDALRR